MNHRLPLAAWEQKIQVGSSIFEQDIASGPVFVETAAELVESAESVAEPVEIGELAAEPVETAGPALAHYSSAVAEHC